MDLDNEYGKLENSWNSKADDEVQNIGERSDVKVGNFISKPSILMYQK